MKDIASCEGGWRFLLQFNSSPSELIMKSLPEYQWHPWKFGKVHQNFWANPENQRNFLLWLEKELKFTNKDDWYKATAKVKYSNKNVNLKKRIF
jgi:hypothetical protein